MLFVAQGTNDLFLNRLEHINSEVIPNTVDVEAIEEITEQYSRRAARVSLGLDLSTVVVSIIGTTCHRKGQDIFLREMAQLKADCPDKKFRFFVVGARRNEFYDNLLKLKSQYGLDLELEFVAERPDVSAYFMASNVLVIASREESAPLVSLEAFAYRTPLVSTRVFGLSEQIDPEYNALAFEIDIQGDLAAQVKRLIEDEVLAATLVENAKNTLQERFSPEFQIDAYWDALESVLLEKKH